MGGPKLNHYAPLWIKVLPLAFVVMVAVGLLLDRRSTEVQSALVASPHLKTACLGQASAVSPDELADAENLVVGPFVWIEGARHTPASTIREFGGNKFFVAVRQGHVATVELSRRAHRFASLYYSQGGGVLTETRVSDGKRVLTFRACRGKRRLRDGEYPATKWIGFVLASKPMCLRMKVWIDDEVAPSRQRIPLGRRC